MFVGSFLGVLVWPVPETICAFRKPACSRLAYIRSLLRFIWDYLRSVSYLTIFRPAPCWDGQHEQEQHRFGDGGEHHQTGAA